MSDRIKELTRFKVTDDAGNEFELIETSVLPPFSYNARNRDSNREIERRFALTDGTPVDRITWQQFQLGNLVLTRA